MFRNIYLTHWPRAIKCVACAVILATFLTTACQKSSVTDVAQANPNTPATAPSVAPSAVLPAASAPATTIGNPALASSPGQPPGQVGIAPDYQAQMANGATPAPGAATNGTPNMQRLNNSKVTMVKGIPELPTPPPTPTPTPAPTPNVEMVNGKVKQQWEAPAEFTAMASPLKVTSDVVKRGKALYQNSCEICHGAEGKGNGAYNSPQWKQATNLTSKVVQANTDGELFYKVSNSRDRHPSKKVMYTDEERWTIVAFLRTLR